MPAARVTEDDQTRAIYYLPVYVIGIKYFYFTEGTVLGNITPH